MSGIGGLYAADPAALPSPEGPERFETLALGSGSVRVERIVSNGQVTPEGEWYDQDWDEWVVVLEGEARLGYEDGHETTLGRGESHGSMARAARETVKRVAAAAEDKPIMTLYT